MFSVLSHVESGPKEVGGDVNEEEENGEWERSAVNKGGEDVMEDVETEAEGGWDVESGKVESFSWAVLFV